MATQEELEANIAKLKKQLAAEQEKLKQLKPLRIGKARAVCISASRLPEGWVVGDQVRTFHETDKNGDGRLIVEKV